MLIDRAIEIIFLNKKDEVIGALNEIENFSINTSSETKDKNAADGSLIMRFYNAKTVEVSAENSVVSLSLMGLQTASGKKVAGTEENPTLIVPAIEQKTIKNRQITLDHTPEDEIVTVVGLTAAGVPDADKNYVVDTDYTIADNVITFIALEDGTDVQVYYEFETASAVKVDQLADDFPTSCHAIAKVIVYDPCDKETARLAYID